MGPTSWGRLARKGAGSLADDDRPDRSEGRRHRGSGRSARPEPGGRDKAASSPTSGRDRTKESRAAIESGLRRGAEGAVERGRDRPVRPRKPLPDRPRGPEDPAAVLIRMLGEKKGRRMYRRLTSASKAFDGERYDDARAELVPVVSDAPKLVEGRELMGLIRYRMGNWSKAIEELESFRELSGSTEQHPVLADCHRALGHWADVDALWTELGAASPSGALVTEGRIVTAGALADRGDVAGAIRMLGQGWKLPKRPGPHHLRRAYALADLYERGGRQPRARELFRWVADHAPDLADVEDRVRSLS